ncbi:cation diffusion facilitator family transporter [Altererythrobacter arenosus]|uniref:Cation diffusion facilitator family transporter n=1 Tax=Altererythrobacter arenosus TaxID=3032592 RepID=A0ABY8FUP7_9SPHN|nr:cation diffusion facilitator family transporter [Altererythrobacter sp. CAU 1644]WFL78734.1 cation diffusion facilitator family transporter [Altererythrobacter sp. CAU 1644]
MSAIHLDQRSSLNRGAAIASIATAILLVGLKTWAAWRTGSTAMLGSLADSALDLIASLATLIGVWIAAMPADEDHRFGHGKAEALAAIFQVMLIAVSAAGIGYRGIDRLINGVQTEAAAEGIGVSAIAIVATLALLTWQRYVIRRTGSLAIKTDNVHYQSDLLLNLAVIAALVLDQYLGIAQADPLFGIGIAAWLAWGAWHAASEAVDHLMDKEWPDEKRDAFLEVLSRHPDIRGVHDLRTRTSGSDDFVQFHMAVDRDLTIVQVHDLMDEVEARLEKEFPGVEVLIHPDPKGLVNEEGVAAEELLPDRAG